MKHLPKLTPSASSLLAVKGGVELGSDRTALLSGVDGGQNAVPMLRHIRREGMHRRGGSLRVARS